MCLFSQSTLKGFVIWLVVPDVCQGSELGKKKTTK
jgi:hypothetical protein